MRLTLSAATTALTLASHPTRRRCCASSAPIAADALDDRHCRWRHGVSQFELDVWGGSKGGLFANPAAIDLLAKAGLPADPPLDPTGIMQKPGFKVLPVKVACLAIVRTWSNAHPGHLPLFTPIGNKDGRPSAGNLTAPEPLTPESVPTYSPQIYLLNQS
jgi:hypothetical protein